MRNAILAAVAVLFLAGCGSGETLEIAAANARFAVAQNESQTGRIEELEDQIGDLEARLEALEQRLGE